MITNTPFTNGTERLSVEEQQLFTECEAVVRNHATGYLPVGEALTRIQNQRLYRERYRTFHIYCRTQIGMSRQTAYQYITAAGVANNVRNCGHPIPANESQCRVLATLPADQQVEAWEKLLILNTPEQLTARQVKGTVQKLSARRPVNDIVPSAFDQSTGQVCGIPWQWPVLRAGVSAAGNILFELNERMLVAPTRTIESLGHPPVVIVSPAVDFFHQQSAPGLQQQLITLMQAAPFWTFLVWTSRLSPDEIKKIVWPHNVRLGVRVQNRDHYQHWHERRELTVFARVSWLWYCPTESLTFPEGRWERILLGPWQRPAEELPPAELRWLRTGLAKALQTSATVHLADDLLRRLLALESSRENDETNPIL